MTMALFPTEVVAMAWTDIAEVRAFVGIGDVPWDALIVQTGDPGTQLRNIAIIPASVLRSAAAAAVVPVVGGGDRGLSPMEAAQIGLVWRIIQRIAARNAGIDWALFADIDPMVVAVAAPIPPPLPAAAGGPAIAASPSRKKLKLSATLDQTDEAEVETVTNLEMRG